jgi:hypothetical protein
MQGDAFAIKLTFSRQGLFSHDTVNLANRV